MSGPVAAAWTASSPPDRRGLLRTPDPLLAAQHLNYLILSVPLNEAMFNGRDTPYGRRLLNRYADEAVRVFMAAYGA
jgi:TetR/AcrR family transcriptional regulator, mexJK operon transcriptional repressor